MKTSTKSPTAIKEMGSALYEAAFNQVAAENNLTRDELTAAMAENDVPAIRIESYMRSALNFAISKL